MKPILTNKRQLCLVSLLALFMLVNFGCSDLPVMGSGSSDSSSNKLSSIDVEDGLSFSDEDMVQSEEKIKYPTLVYSGTGYWSESSYGTYKLSTVKTTVKTSAEKLEANITNIQVVSGKHLGDVRPNIPTTKKTTYQRTSREDLDKHRKADSSFRSDVSFLIFSHKTSEKWTYSNGTAQTYNFNFNKPIPVLVRGDQAAIIENAFKNTNSLVFNTNISGKYEAKMTTTITMVDTTDVNDDGNYTRKANDVITLKISNNITSHGYSSSNLRRDEIYAVLPVPKVMHITIDTIKEEIISISTNSEFLMSKYSGSKARKNGNTAQLHAGVDLCTSTVEGKVTQFNKCN